MKAAGPPATRTASRSDWPSYNGNLESQRYSPLTEITTGNAPSLHRVCSTKLSEVGAFQAGPIVTGGTLYITTSTSTYAIDPTTCALKWTNVRGKPDGHLLALDASTGKTLWDVVPAFRGVNLRAC